jgi:hypothetical protein
MIDDAGATGGHGHRNRADWTTIIDPVIGTRQNNDWDGPKDE